MFFHAHRRFTFSSLHLLLFGVSFFLAALLFSGTAYAADTISSDASQLYLKNQADIVIPTITVTNVDDDMSAVNDVRIRIPSTTNMTWDAADTEFTCANLSGTPCTNISTTVSYESSDKVLVLDVTTNLTVGDSFTVSGLNFEAFTGASAADNFDLCVDGDCTAVEAVDDKTITIGAPTISSNANQTLYLDSDLTAMDWTITITESSTAAGITSADDIVVAIPSDLTLTFYPSDTTVSVSGDDYAKVEVSEGGAACSSDPCDVTVTFAQSDGSTACTFSALDCRTMIVPVDTDWSTSDSITLTGFTFGPVTSAGETGNLELEAAGSSYFGSSATDADDKTLTLRSFVVRDTTPTNPVREAEIELNASGEVVLTWLDPTDGDFSGVSIIKSYEEDGELLTTSFAVSPGVQTFTDENIHPGDELTYVIRAFDLFANSIDSSALTIVIPGGEEDVEEVVGEQEEEEVQEEEVQEGEEIVFEDTIDHWAFDYIKDLHEKGVVAGYEDGSFGVEDNVTRAQFLKMVLEAKDVAFVSSDESSFDDVSEEDWFFPYVETAYMNEYVQGFEDGTFGPEDSVSRADAMVILLNVYGFDLLEGLEGTSFDDVPLDAYYALYVETAFQAGLISGYEDGVFAPMDNLTRSQAAKIVSLAMAL